MKRIDERLSYYNSGFEEMDEALQIIKGTVSTKMFPKQVVQDILDLTVAIQSYVADYGIVDH